MDEREITLKDIWNILLLRKKMIIRNVIIVSIIVSGISLLFSNWYKATAVILPPSSDNASLGTASLLSNFGLGGFLGGGDDQSRILSIAKSRSLLESVAQKFNFQKVYETENMEETIKILEGNLAIDLHEEMQISISFWDKDQEKVAEITNYIVDCIDSLNIALSTNKAKNNRIFIESRVNDILDSLKYLESEITSFMEEEGILSLTDQVSVSVEKAADLKAQIMTKEIEQTIAKNVLDRTNPKLKQLQTEIKSLKNKYQEFYKENSSDKLMPNFNKVPALGIKFTRLQRKTEYYIKLLEYLGPQYESAKIEEAKTIPTIQILDLAVRPEKKDRPKRSRIVLGFFVIALTVSIYYAYFKGRNEYLKRLS